MRIFTAEKYLEIRSFADTNLKSEFKQLRQSKENLWNSDIVDVLRSFPCHHCMASPRSAGGGICSHKGTVAAINWVSRQEQPTGSDPTAWRMCGV